MYWCMISNDAPATEGDAIHWLRHANPTVVGVSHDGANTVYPHTPPVELAGNRVMFEPNLTLVAPETGDDSAVIAELMGRLASFMVQDSSDIMLIDREYLKRLFNTPHHRLWCANYDADSRQQFDQDWAAVMPMSQPDMTFTDLQQYARAAVKAAFS